MEMEPLRQSGVDAVGRGSFGKRIDALERDVAMLKQTAKTAADNTHEILLLLSHTKSVVGFTRRHLPKVVAAAVGAGFFNPSFSKFITAIFN